MSESYWVNGERFIKCPECSGPMRVGERECEAAQCEYLAKEIQLDDWEEFQRRKEQAKRTGSEVISEEWETYKNLQKDPKTGKLLANLSLEDAQKIVKIKSEIVKEGHGPTMNEITNRENKLYQRITCNWVQWVPSRAPQAGCSEESYISKLDNCTFNIPQAKTCRYLAGSALLDGTNSDGWPLGMELCLLEMRLGEERIIACPPELAWGDKPHGEFIPAYSFVTFKIYLKSHQPIKMMWG